MENPAPVCLFIAMSLDGFIAGPGDNLDFLSIVEAPGEDYGYSHFISGMDTVIMGRKTYEKVLSFGVDFPHRGRKCYVLTKTRTGEERDVEFYNGPLDQLIEKIRKDGSTGIFCDGGGEVIRQLMQNDLIDRYTISIIPVLLGGGVRLFDEANKRIGLKLKEVKSFPAGLVQISYERIWKI